VPQTPNSGGETLLNQIFLKIELLLKEVKSVDIGFPIGENVIRPPRSRSEVDGTLRNLGVIDYAYLFDFYCRCDGLSWPDVHNGYFVDSVRNLGRSDPDSDPDRIEGIGAENVLAIGSSGGGELFVLGKQSQRILLLPPGLLVSGVYHNRDGQARGIASNIAEMLQLFANDLEAFVKNTPGYAYCI
jgi:hypothetical protein